MRATTFTIIHWSKDMTQLIYALEIQIGCDVVVIDDEEPIAQLIADVLRDEGYTVSIFHDGASALLAIIYGKPRLVVLDLMLPIMTGAEVLHMVRARGLTSVPIIVMSAGVRLEQYRAQGADELLAKPFDINTLVGYVKQYLPD